MALHRASSLVSLSTPSSSRPSTASGSSTSRSRSSNSSTYCFNTNWKASGISYTSKGGSKVCIPSYVNPNEILGIAMEKMTPQLLKTQFRKKILSEDRNQRALVSLAYAILCDVFYKNECPYFQESKRYPKRFMFDAANPIVEALTGQSEALKQQASVTPSVLNACEPQGYSLLYIASRSGYMDLVTFLIQAGADVNHVENVKGLATSALHAASYYGHYPVVNALVARGASVTLKNHYGSTAIEEAQTTLIEDLLKESLTNPLQIFIQKIHNIPFMNKMEEIVKGGKIVAYRIQRNVSERKMFIKEWVRAWHGTKKEHVMSILKNGLRKPGEVVDGVTVKIPNNHIAAGTTVDEIKDWPSAIFVSPEVKYASHVCYSERIANPGKGEFCILLEVAVRPKSFTLHSSTVFSYGDSSGDEEMRVDATSETSDERSDDAHILRVSVSANVVVLAATLLSVDFMESSKKSDGELAKLICGEDI